MNKKDREIIRMKFNNKCAYCGCELQKGWHIDHVNAVHRKTKNIGGDIVTKDTGLRATENDIANGNYTITPRKIVANGFHYPENHCLENMQPSCPSCNIYKGGCDLETFRFVISKTVSSLNKREAQYKFAKRFHLIEETNKPVIFYFESVKTELEK